jgi:RNA polymerase sigma-70 factor (ECF subfamily)
MPSPQDHDELLMAQVAAGRRELLETLIRRHASPLLTFIRRMVGDAHRSEELFQEAFLAVWVKRKQYQFPRPFKPWLYQIALNKCRETFRRRASSGDQTLDEEGPSGRGPSPSDAAIAVETAALVSAAVTRLPPQQRAVVVLRMWDGLSFAEIAEVVQRSEGTVRSNMHHGLAALRKILEPHAG